jgi:predicted nucleic acid-binding protein
VKKREFRAVSDAGPLIALGKLKSLSLIEKLYGKICISEEVYREAVLEGIKRGYDDALSIKLFIEHQGIETVRVKHSEIEPALLEERLDPGEIETIHLALVLESDVVLLDEEAAREAARRRKLRVKGTIGVIVEGFRKHILSLEEAELMLEEIEHRNDIWINHRLCSRAIEDLRAKS